MSTYVSDLIADNINSINVAQKLSEVSAAYNLDILSVIGEEASASLPDIDAQGFMAHCDSLRNSLTSKVILPLADSVVYSYTAFMLTSLELQDVLHSDFIDSRSWYFDRLQPRFNRLRGDIDSLTSAIYRDLKKNSADFDSGFYRSIIPGAVAVGVGILLVLMLIFFMLSYYVNPIYHMLSSLKAYIQHGKTYNYSFEGDDQLSELNSSIFDLTVENRNLKQRINILKEKDNGR
ncbi:MAG: hypothetical protein PUB45_04515 [Bacteroidales bacterium]|nr:hypothetical protein [Bacteroidales bacterium]